MTPSRRYPNGNKDGSVVNSRNRSLAIVRIEPFSSVRRAAPVGICVVRAGFVGWRCESWGERREGSLIEVRRVLLSGFVVLLLVCGGAASAGAWFWAQFDRDTSGKVGFVNKVAIPPLAPSHVDAAGRRVFNLKATAGKHTFGKDTVSTWGFNGGYLGPTLRAERGEKVLINVTNGLNEDTTVHWHGMHLPAKMDGGPHQLVAPGKTWSPTWTVDQPAATLWYHPHPHGKTMQHVYRGLAGMFIIDDPKTSSADLPHRYGVDDIPLMVQDKQIADGKLDETARSLGVGILGGTIAVNGTVGPYLDVQTERVRLRLLNGNTARIYNFGFADGRKFTVVGSDGGLLPETYDTERLVLSPGERAEVVVTMQPGQRSVLRSYPGAAKLDILHSRFTGIDDTFDIIELRAAKTLTGSPQVPRKLVTVPRLDPKAATEKRKLVFGGEAINGRPMEMSRVDYTVEKGSTEIWTVTSEDLRPHNLHIHDVQFQVLTLDGKAPPPQLAGWKDTVFLPPRTTYELIMRFDDYADPDSPYMYHCHVLLHEDEGMMGQFVVVNPGQKSGVIAAPKGGGHSGSHN
ncbi:multicopper oxidase domain-containing protein [Micromonospora yasonensis]|uniref:multicopper oxidase family protein n=1 Tax=Micromonospora yasonensis TaxID=1128667 RepID=UPI00222FEE4F|nr:multicopper oxidase domain-containing protein [Micromonospora yasonensis]MCW3844513.1 multicopper oxidase domain-containing protein [Micromonospora yasonensis]